MNTMKNLSKIIHTLHPSPIFFIYHSVPIAQQVASHLRLIASNWCLPYPLLPYQAKYLHTSLRFFQKQICTGPFFFKFEPFTLDRWVWCCVSHIRQHPGNWRPKCRHPANGTGQRSVPSTSPDIRSPPLRVFPCGPGAFVFVRSEGLFSPIHRISGPILRKPGGGLMIKQRGRKTMIVGKVGKVAIVNNGRLVGRGRRNEVTHRDNA
jgi:hypothetical protein